MLNQDDFDYIVEQPFLTEDGFINEACKSQEPQD